MSLGACSPSTTPEDQDIPATRARYERERAARIRPEATAQYREAADDLADYYEVDPHSPPTVRAPIDEDVDVAVLGGGFAGLIAAARLKEAGVANVRIIEMAGDFGGTWYWNRYPGVQCDVESYTYLPLLEETGYLPKERYSFGPEIYEHCQRVGRHFGLYDHALFGTIVRAMRWDDELKRWRIETNHGDDLRARFVILACGPLNKPKLPGIEGLTSFRGRSFHTARWDYDYTGGDTFGGLDKLGDKRVAIIGTGATAIQCIPFLGEHAKHLYVFQRTPSSVDVRGNHPTDPEWAKTLTPGWQARRQRNFHSAVFETFATPQDDLICDGWGEIARNMAARLADCDVSSLPLAELLALREQEDYRVMGRLRQRISEIVKDPETAERLKPWYRFLCKRPCFNDNYLPTFNRPNVTLVDVSGSQGVERITETGLVANGAHYDVDCIVFASGFEVTTDLRRRYGIGAIEGLGGLSLYDHWSDGYRTLHGMMANGFPNLFLTGYAQSTVAAAINVQFDMQAQHIAYIVSETLGRGGAAVEPTAEAQDDWVATIRSGGASATDFLRQCTPGYYNNEGSKVVVSPLYGEALPAGYDAFVQILTEWRASGEMPGLQMSS